jgi:SAM-dependent methyltransferase
MRQLQTSTAEYFYEHSDASCAHPYLLGPLKKLIQSVGTKGTVLDLGCGNGSLSHELSKFGFEVYGLTDPNREFKSRGKHSPKFSSRLGMWRRTSRPIRFSLKVLTL